MDMDSLLFALVMSGVFWTFHGINTLLNKDKQKRKREIVDENYDPFYQED